MNWYWHITWAGVTLTSAWWLRLGLLSIGVALVNIEKSRIHRADEEKRRQEARK